MIPTPASFASVGSRKGNVRRLTGIRLPGENFFWPALNSRIILRRHTASRAGSQIVLAAREESQRDQKFRRMRGQSVIRVFSRFKLRLGRSAGDDFQISPPPASGFLPDFFSDVRHSSSALPIGSISPHWGLGGFHPALERKERA